ncbi:MAG: YceI family protein [Leptospiraceae bacterium]|nr:YceI family protein [Leptospiraceae bacterium]
MYRTILSLIVTAFVFASCAEAPDAEKAGTGEARTESTSTGDKQSINLADSKISWIGTKLTGQHNGTIKLKSGHILLDGDQIKGGEFVMDMSTIEVHDLTGENKQKLEKHLRDTDFFEIQKFPESRFVITSVEQGENGKLQVTGNLTMRDITKSVSFTATTEKGDGGKPVKVSADFNIDRQLWGIVYKGKPDDAIRDEVNLKPVLVLD